MAVNPTKRYTTTGVQAAVDLNESHSVTVGITSENADVTITSIEFQIGNNWYTDASVTEYAEAKAYGTTTPVRAVRCNVSNLGTSSYYDLDITASNR